MIQIDLMTIIFVLICLNLLSAVFFAVYMAVTKQRTYMTYYTLSKMLQGIAWTLRLFTFLYLSPPLGLVADVFTILGYSSESAIFVHYNNRLDRKASIRYSVLLTFILIVLIILDPINDNLKNLVIVTSFLTFMYIAAMSLITKKDPTTFQRILGIIFILIPSMIVMLFILVQHEVSIPGQNTSLGALIYYSLILMLQITGSIGFLLVVNETDEKLLLDLARKDALTGLLNRSSFYKIAQKQIEQAMHRSLPISLLLIDIDDFNKINSTYGQPTGDAVLKDVAMHLLSTNPGATAITRYYGDTFLIFNLDMDRATCDGLAQYTLSYIKDHQILKFDLPYYTISIGTVTEIPRDHLRLDHLLHVVEDAVHVAKSRSKNCICRYVDADPPVYESIH